MEVNKLILGDNLEISKTVESGIEHYISWLKKTSAQFLVGLVLSGAVGCDAEIDELEQVEIEKPEQIDCGLTEEIKLEIEENIQAYKDYLFHDEAKQQEIWKSADSLFRVWYPSENLFDLSDYMSCLSRTSSLALAYRDAFADRIHGFISKHYPDKVIDSHSGNSFMSSWETCRPEILSFKFNIVSITCKIETD